MPTLDEFYLRDRIHDILKEFEFCYNSASTRAAIENKVSMFLYDLKCQNLIYDFKACCDDANNPPSVVESGNVIITGYTEDLFRYKHTFYVSLQ